MSKFVRAVPIPSAIPGVTTGIMGDIPIEEIEGHTSRAIGVVRDEGQLRNLILVEYTSVAEAEDEPIVEEKPQTVRKRRTANVTG